MKKLFKINRQGEPIINNGYIIEQNKIITAVEIDMRSKWCVVDCTTGGDHGIPGIWIDKTDRSLHLHKSKKEVTIIEFPIFKGLDIFTAECCRYTLRVVFINMEEYVKKYKN
jgi:hypothetical protein